MRKLLIASLVLMCASIAEARGRRYQQPSYSQPQQSYNYVSPPVIPKTSPISSGVPGSAQWKAEISAKNQSVAHIGGGFGGGTHEGNGMGSTPEQAITVACYWGQLTPIEIGVARSSNGMYYATIFYR